MRNERKTAMFLVILISKIDFVLSGLILVDRICLQLPLFGWKVHKEYLITRPKAHLGPYA